MEAKNNTLIKCIVIYFSFALLISIGVHAASVVKGILLHPEDGEVNPTIEAYVDGVIKPTIYWDTVLEKWSFSHDGVKSSVFGSGGGGSRLNLMENSSFEEGEEGTCTFCSMSIVPSFLASPSNENALQVTPELGGGTWGRHIDHDAIYSGVEGLISFWIQTDHIVDGIFFVDGNQVTFQVEPNVKPQYFEHNFKMGSVSIGLDLWGDNPFFVDEIYMGANVTEDLQRAYERSDGGKISINNELGAIKIIDETGVTNTPLLKILSNDELVEYFSVKDQQTIVGNELLIKDKIAFQNGGAEIFSTSFMSPDIYGVEAPTGSLVLSNNNLHIKQSQLDDYDWAKVAHSGNFNEFANSHLNAFENPGFEVPDVYDVLWGTGQRVLKNKSVTPYDKYALRIIPTNPTLTARWSIEENSGSFTGQEIIVGCQAWSDNPTATLAVFKDSFEVFRTSITPDAQGYYIPLIGGSAQHRVSVSALEGDPIWVDNCFAGTVPIGSGGGIGGSRLNLIEHPSFEKGMVDEIVCTNATVEIEEDVVLKTGNNKKSVKITATDDNAFCIVDKEVNDSWDASIDVIKFAWFKTDASGAKFISRVDGADEGKEVHIDSLGTWHSRILRTKSGTMSNGYKILLPENGNVVHLDEQELRPLNSSDARIEPYDGLPFGELAKLDTRSPAFVKTGAQTISVKAGTKMAVGESQFATTTETPVSMPVLTPGTDYAIYICTDGEVLASSNFTQPEQYDEGDCAKLGGFHYGLVSPTETVTGGLFATTGNGMHWTQEDVDRIKGINEFSIWDLNFRPSCEDPRGMALVANQFWVDIYFTNTDHEVNGTSKAGTDVASGTVLPKVHTVFGGDGSKFYPNGNWWTFAEIAKSHGKRLLNFQEFAAAAYGTTEATSLGGASTTIPLTKREPGFTSKFGLEQVSGHSYTWGAEISGSVGSSSWSANTDGRGSTYATNLSAPLYGGRRAYAANSGSRSSNWRYSPWHSSWSTGLRAACDLTLK